jgi:hypothetical protein
LVDCSKNDDNAGCDGGFMDAAYKYVKESGGIDTAKIYPYEGIVIIENSNFKITILFTIMT